jgi:hypothetical protein
VTAASRNRVPATRVQDVPIRDTTGAHRDSWSTPLGAERDPGDDSRAVAGRAHLPRPVSGTRSGGRGGTHPRQAPPTNGPREGTRAGEAASAPGDRLPGDRSVTPEEPGPAGGRAAPSQLQPPRLGLAPSARPPLAEELSGKSRTSRTSRRGARERGDSLPSREPAGPNYDRQATQRHRATAAAGPPGSPEQPGLCPAHHGHTSSLGPAAEVKGMPAI